MRYDIYGTSGNPERGRGRAGADAAGKQELVLDEWKRSGMTGMELASCGGEISDVDELGGATASGAEWENARGEREARWIEAVVDGCRGVLAVEVPGGLVPRQGGWGRWSWRSNCYAAWTTG